MVEVEDGLCSRKLLTRSSRYSGLAVCSRHYDRERYRANLAADPDYYKKKRAKNGETVGSGCMVEVEDGLCGRKLVTRSSRYSGLAVCSRHYDRERHQANVAADPAYYQKKRAKNLEGSRAASRRHRLAHIEEARAYGRRYSQENAAKIAARNKARYDVGGRERARKWEAEHPGSNRAAAAKRRRNNRPATTAEARRWRVTHPDQVLALSRRARARRAGVPTEPYRAIDIFDRDGWVCQLCERPIDPRQPAQHSWTAELDHIVPISWGGPDTPANVWAAHRRCNIRKRALYSGKPPGGPQSLWEPGDDLDVAS